jgi:glyoxylase-like metal-dependent hydrolase (beta-lactamase superfamily II)
MKRSVRIAELKGATRRAFLRGAAASVTSALAFRFGRRAHAESARIDAVRLSPRVLAVFGPDANSLAVEGDDAVILVDGGSAAWSEALLARVDTEFASKPIRALINTHWHPEQVGSNVALGSRGSEIVAHENTKLWLGTETWVRWSGEKYPPLPTTGLPSKTFLDSTSLRLAGRTVDCRYLLNAHTDGDVSAFFADENVLVTGGAVSNDGWPVIDWWTGGWIGGMLDAYDALIGIVDDRTRIVPSRGPVMSLGELRSQQAMYVTIFDRLQDMLRKSFGTNEVLAAHPTAEFNEQWGDPTQFVTLAFHSMWGHVRDAYDTRLRTIP